MPKTRNFDYLKDGQNLPKEMAEANAFAQTSAVLSALLSTAKEDLKSARMQCLEILRHMREQIGRYAAQIPVPTSIFVGERERAPAHAAVCRLLVVLEEDVRKLSSAAFLFTNVEENLFTYLKKQNLQDVVSDKAQAETNFARSLVTESRREREAVIRFCTVTVSDFCKRVEREGDLEHEGAACNPAALARLCGELKAAAEQTERDLENEVMF